MNHLGGLLKGAPNIQCGDAGRTSAHFYTSSLEPETGLADLLAPPLVSCCNPPGRESSAAFFSISSPLTRWFPLAGRNSKFVPHHVTTSHHTYPYTAYPIPASGICTILLPPVGAIQEASSPPKGIRGADRCVGLTLDLAGCRMMRISRCSSLRCVRVGTLGDDVRYVCSSSLALAAGIVLDEHVATDCSVVW